MLPVPFCGTGILILKAEVKPTWMQTLAAAQRWADEHRRPVGTLISEVAVPCSLSKNFEQEEGT